MKVIKTPKANLEKKRFRFFRVGVVVSCSLALLAFRWTTYELSSTEKSGVYVPEFEELEAEIAELSFRKQSSKAKSVRIKLDLPIFDPDKKDIDLGLEVEKVITDPEIDWEGLEYDENGENDGAKDVVVIPVSKESSWMKAERTPYFDECASPSDKEAEAKCTYLEIRNFVQLNTRYPEDCREMGIQGTVWLTFVIDKNGDVVEIEEIRSPHVSLTNAAMESVGQLPKMNPGTQRLRPVDVRLEIPVKFTLR